MDTFLFSLHAFFSMYGTLDFQTLRNTIVAWIGSTNYLLLFRTTIRGLLLAVQCMSEQNKERCSAGDPLIIN